MSQRRAFTLIELLMVISIMAILATLALVTLRGVRDDARNTRTRSVIAQVRDILEEKLDLIASRPLPFAFQRDFYQPTPQFAGQAVSDLVPNHLQRQSIYRRTLCELVRAELPTEREYLNTFPSAESLQPNNLADDRLPGYWPDVVATRNWVGIYQQLLFRRPNSVRQMLLTRLMQSSPGTDFLIDNNRAIGEYWCIENNHGWDGVVVPGVNNALNPNQLAHTVAEAGDLLYLILNSSYDRDGNRATAFLSPEDLGDTNQNGIPEIVDGRGYPLIFSITVKATGDDGTLLFDRNGDGLADFLDRLLDPRFARDPQDYQIHLGSIANDEYPPHLQHLRHADFTGFDL